MAEDAALSPQRHLAWGVGIGYRSCIHRQVMASRHEIDFLEIAAEDYVDATRRKYADPGERMLQEAVAHFPVVAHGTDVSVGSAEPPAEGYVARVERFVKRFPAGEYSEHLTCTRAGREHVNAFIAIPFTDLGVAATVANARRLARRVGLPFLLENVCYHFAIPGATMREEEFLKRVVMDVDCGILLDLTNVYINAHNHRYDPRAFIKALPPERILHVHFCGVLVAEDGYFLDTHSEITPREVWQLMDETLATTDLRAVILERDSGFSPWEPLVNELRVAREIFRKHRPSVAPATLKGYAPSREVNAVQDDGEGSYSKELALFQEILMSMLLDQELARAVDREGEPALRHTGLGKDERRYLAAIPARKRDFLATTIRMDREYEAKWKEKCLREEWARWGS